MKAAVFFFHWCKKLSDKLSFKVCVWLRETLTRESYQRRLENFFFRYFERVDNDIAWLGLERPFWNTTTDISFIYGRESDKLTLWIHSANFYGVSRCTRHWGFNFQFSVCMQTDMQRGKWFARERERLVSNHNHFSWVLSMCRGLCALYHLLFTTIWNAYYHLPDFIDKETGLEEVK